MLRQEIKGLLEATPRDLRKFGLVVGGVLAALGLFFLWRQKPWYPAFLFPGVPLMVLGALLPATLKWPYVVWMALAMVLGAIVSTVLLTLLFYLMVTPIGLAARLAGRDFLRLKPDAGAPSYWLIRERTRVKSRHDHEQQF